MTDILKAELYCPPMKIFSTVWPDLRETDAEPMEFKGTFADGSTVEVKPVTISKTLIDKIGLLHWKVRDCVGRTEMGVRPLVESHLPPEDTKWSWWFWTMVAEQMRAPTDVTLADGRVYSGFMVYPPAYLNIFTMTVSAPTAIGDLERVN